MKFRVDFLGFVPTAGDYEVLKFEVQNLSNSSKTLEIVEISRTFCQGKNNSQLIDFGYCAMVNLVNNEIPENGFRDESRDKVYISSFWAPNVEIAEEDILLKENNFIEFEKKKRKFGFLQNQN